jgi:hypothetical protein
MHITVVIAVVFALGAIACPSPLHAQWQENGVTIAATTGEEEAPKIAIDGAGGAIIVWQTVYRTPDIYAQRLDADGYIQWTAGGIAVCAAANGQHKPEIVTDGAGGAIIAWSDFRNGNADIYAQRLDADGNPIWPVDGIAVCTVEDTFGWWMMSRVRLVPYEGGVILAWHDNRSGNDDIYAQRLDADGNILWTPNGVAVCTAFGDQNDVEMIADGAGGAIIVWKDERSDEGDIYAQRIAPDSTLSWPPNGAPVCTATGEQEYHSVATDGAGGAIACWMDGDWETSDIYAQRISSEGLLRWPPRGRAVCTAIKQQAYPDITPDCYGGAFIVWSDQRNDVWYDHDIYGQRVDQYGFFYWTANGIKISEHQSKDHLEPRIIRDGYGGAILTWWSGEPLPGGGAGRPTARSSAYDDETIYAQRITADSIALWEEHGLKLCTYPDYMTTVRPRLVTDEQGGTIVTWCNIINNTGIYAQRVNANGNAPPASVEDPPSAAFLAQNHPNPFNPTTTIRFGLTRRVHVALRIYDPAGRLVCTLIDGYRDAGTHRELWNGCDDKGRAVESGIYFYRLTAGPFGEAKKLVLIR